MAKIFAVMSALLAVAFLALAQQSDTGDGDYRPTVGTTPAADFPEGLEWINSRPLSLEDLRGKIVLLDFLTYGCINCIHVIPDLHELEARYPDELVVIGVHSAKFDNESESENIARFAQRYEVVHPLVNDEDFQIWREYGIRAWPTSVLIDPEGKVVRRHEGEGVLAGLGASIANMVRTFEDRGTLDRTPLQLSGPQQPAPASALSFPGNLLADEQGDRLFIADTNHHRLIVTDLEGTVLEVYGSGQPGFEDGAGPLARFLRPQGMALAQGNLLYVADSGNHSIRLVDLEAGIVTTVAGTGEQGYMWGLEEADAAATGLNSPWDLDIVDGQVFIAMAGQHQLWRYDPSSGLVHLHAGSGREALIDGALRQAGLNQPTGLAVGGGWLFVADSEASAVRAVSPAQDGHIATLVGTGLFDFGDVDGEGREVRLQHPTDVAYYRGQILVSDTYNHKIKWLDPAALTVSTLLGSGEAGWQDGANALFYEPGGISVANDRLYIADTNNHAVRVADLRSGAVHTLELSDAGGLLQASSGDAFAGEQVTLEQQTLAAGTGELRLEVSLPPQYKVNELSPFSVEWRAEGDAVIIDSRHRRQEIAAAEFPLSVSVPVRLEPGAALVTARVHTYYCREGQEALCLIDRVDLTVPVTVAEAGRESLLLTRTPPPLPE